MEKVAPESIVGIWGYTRLIKCSEDM